MHILKFSVLSKFKIINIPRKSIINNNNSNNNNNNNNNLEVVHPQSGLFAFMKVYRPIYCMCVSVVYPLVGLMAA